MGVADDDTKETNFGRLFRLVDKGDALSGQHLEKDKNPYYEKNISRF